jgi:membrane-bound lytic murein transglycosylase A
MPRRRRCWNSNSWYEDNQGDALVAFLKTCDLIDAPDWRPICALASEVPQDDASARSFFELLFRPVLIGTPPALFTGYFEPELEGSPVRTGRFAYPIYRRPPELRDGQAYHTRATIEGGILAGRGLEIAWLDYPIDASPRLWPHSHDRRLGGSRRLCRG